MPAAKRTAGKTDKADKVGAGSQTLMRGLDVIEAVAHGRPTLTELATQLGLTKSTTHRLASALSARGFLAPGSRGAAYRLGPKLLELGEVARDQFDLVEVARPHIEELSRTTSDTVHLGVLEDEMALYLDKVNGQRRITISSRVGERQPLTTTGLGKALLLDHPAAYWRERWGLEAGDKKDAGALDQWLTRMEDYVQTGRAFDLEENEDRIRCVAAPVRGIHGEIVAAISVSSAAQYMDDDRMKKLTDEVKGVAEEISRELGYSPEE